MDEINSLKHLLISLNEKCESIANYLEKTGIKLYEDDCRYGILKINNKYEVYDRQSDFKVLEVFNTRRKAENYRKRKINNGS